MRLSPEVEVLIIWGQKPYFKTKKVKSHGFCSQCQQFGKRYSFHARTFFHLYYIPLFPVSARIRHHQCCAKCSKYVPFPEEQFDGLVASLKERSADALLALADGESTVVFNGERESEPVDCVSYLVDVIDWLHDAGEQEFVDNLIARLGQPQHLILQEMMQAELLRIQGRRREAIDQFQGVMSKRGAHPVAARRVAFLLTVEKRHIESAEAWDKALSVETDPHQRVGLLALRVDSLMAGKQWPEAVKAYDSLFAAQPSIADDKAIKKLYAKAKKKAGVE